MLAALYWAAHVLADTANGYTVLAAFLVAIPSTVAAVGTWRNHAKLSMKNGGTVGKKVEAMERDVSQLKDTALQNRVAILWLQRELTGKDDGGIGTANE